MRMCDMRLMRCLLPLLACSLLAVFTRLADAEFPKNYVAGELVTLTDNGAWSWFMDERAIVADGKVIVGSVRAVGEVRQGRHDPNWGHAELGGAPAARGGRAVGFGKDATIRMGATSSWACTIWIAARPSASCSIRASSRTITMSRPCCGFPTGEFWPSTRGTPWSARSSTDTPRPAIRSNGDRLRGDRKGPR